MVEHIEYEIRLKVQWIKL